MRGVEFSEIISYGPPSARLLELVMRLNRNFYSEWAPLQWQSSRHAVLVTLVACAVGATASAAVILSLVDFPVTQAGVPPMSPRAIVRNASAPEDTKTVQNRPMVETPMRLAATGIVSDRDEPVTQMEEEHPSEVHSQQLRKHGRVVIHSHAPYWRRGFTHTFSRSPRFSAW